MSLPFNNQARRGLKTNWPRPRAVFERIVFENDPIARFSLNILLNLTHPARSPLLLGPLAKSAGGFGSCGDVFKNVNDPDYQRLLAAIKEAKAGLESPARFATPGFKPNLQYVREMKKFGILPPSFDPRANPIDVYETDQKYWRSFWVQP